MGIQRVVCGGQSFASSSLRNGVIQRTSQKVTQAWGHRGKQRVALYGQRIRVIKTYQLFSRTLEQKEKKKCM